MRSNSRRALRLASALVAAGLALSAAPPALAADDDGLLLTLTDSQAKKLADHAQLNPYADADRETVDPQGATKDSGASGTDGQGSGSHLDEDTGTDGAVTISPKSALEGVRGLAATVPARGKGATTSLCTAWAASSAARPTAPPCGAATTPRCTRTGASRTPGPGRPSRTRRASSWATTRSAPSHRPPTRGT